VRREKNPFNLRGKRGEGKKKVPPQGFHFGGTEPYPWWGSLHLGWKKGGEKRESPPALEKTFFNRDMSEGHKGGYAGPGQVNNVPVKGNPFVGGNLGTVGWREGETKKKKRGTLQPGIGRTCANWGEKRQRGGSSGS